MQPAVDSDLGTKQNRMEFESLSLTKKVGNEIFIFIFFPPPLEYMQKRSSLRKLECSDSVCGEGTRILRSFSHVALY